MFFFFFFFLSSAVHCTGKTAAWKILRSALEQTTGRKISPYVIDPKALTKDELYGTLDSTTLEYSDGIFTAVLRRILDNVRGEQQRDHWIVFDGDVDPQWVSLPSRTADTEARSRLERPFFLL